MIEIRGLLVKIVKDLGNIYPVNVLNRAKKPVYPFLTYNTLTTNTNIREDGIHSVGEDIESLTRQSQLIFSINSYSNNDMEALEEIERAHEYFTFNNELEGLNVVVVNVGDIQNRATLVVDEYEFRYGFDVWIRYVKQIDRNIYNIEKWSVRE